MEKKILDLLHYDPDTGIFTWKVTRNGYVKAGRQAGNKNKDGYIRIKIHKRLYLAHRLAWVWLQNEIPPEMEIDHFNGIRDDNRISNLRCVTKSENMENQKRVHKNNNTTKLMGVSPLPSGRFQAAIQINKKLFYLGSFDTAEEAHQAYLKAKRKFHTGFTE